MDPFKFCFIICVNNEKYLEECLWYIDRLCVPNGYKKENLVVRGASSMASGYNRAMRQTNAKYKIYLHQDVLIINQNILSELLDIFKEDSIGMVGAIGQSEEMSSAAYSLHWNAGAAEVYDIMRTYYIKKPRQGAVAQVAAVDGMFMATQYDLEWEEESFTGWHFYDISQSVKFQLSGYQVVVPCIKEIKDIWVYHDEGRGEFGEWDKYRKVFCEKYATLGYQYEELEGLKLWEVRIQKWKPQIMKAFKSGDFRKTIELIDELGEGNLDAELCYMVNFLYIWQKEMGQIGRASFAEPDQFQQFISIYDEVKFLLRRSHYGWKDEAWDRLREKFYDGSVTMIMISRLAFTCVDFVGLFYGIVRKCREEVRALISQGEIVGAERLLCQLDVGERGRQGNILWTLIQVFCCEVEKGLTRTVFDLTQDVDELMAHYIHLKLYLRRLEFGLSEDYWQEVYDYIIQTGVSDYFIIHILSQNIFLKKEFCLNLAKLFAKNEGKQSVRANIYQKLGENEE